MSSDSERHTDILWQLTCCWLPCRPAGPPAPASPGGAGWGWSGSSFGSGDQVWPCPSARLSPRGSDPVQRLQGWFEMPGGSYWPWGGKTEAAGWGNPQCGVATRAEKNVSYLAWISSWQIEHVEEEAKLTGQTKLLLAQMILHQTPYRLQEI